MFVVEMNNDKTKKKSFKEVLRDNKGRIFIGTSCAVIGGLSIFVLGRSLNKIDEIEPKEIVLDVVKEKALVDAIQTVNRKINYRLYRIEHLITNNINDELLNKYRREIKELMAKTEEYAAEYSSLELR